MRFLDSNVLIAASYQDHDRFEDAHAVLSDARAHGDAMTSAHALAETYSVLTALPKPNRFSPDKASRYVKDAAGFLKIVALDAAAMLALFADLAAAGVAGGRTYDAIHARTAAKHGATAIVTLNRKDFIGLEKSLKIETPAPGRGA